MSRRPHPYFRRLNRLEQVRVIAPGKSRRVEPSVTPASEPGILWDTFRASLEDLTDSG